MKTKVKKYRELVELKGLLREKKNTYRNMARFLGISISAFNDKINGKSVFSILEANEIANELEITVEEMHRYFF